MFVLLVTIGGISAIIIGCGGGRYRAGHNDPPGGRVRSNPEAAVRRRPPKSHGKIRLPADLFVDLVQPERSGDATIVVVSASTDIVSSSGVITLRVPPIGAEPGRTDILWAGAPHGLVARTEEYVVDPLPVGKYHFVAVLEFTPDRENAKELTLSKSLYLDVRPDMVLSSNVSFKHIKRLELRRELEERVLANISPGLAAADQQTMVRYRKLIEATNPGLIDSKIAELKATDPHVARRIMELNATKAETEPDSEAVGTNIKGQPAIEEAVPIRQSPGE